MKPPNETNTTNNINDNRYGLATGFDNYPKRITGMNLMAGLPEQPDGTFSLKNCDGLTVAIIFTKNILRQKWYLNL